MRKPFSTSIEEVIQNEFKEKCSQTIPNIPANSVLEVLMDGYNKGKIKVEIIVSQQEEQKK